ncbi:MAG: glycerate kinase [Kineosporiaceae bacterium]
MRVVLAPDSFRGSLHAPEVCDALAAGVRAARPDSLTTAVPMADGGEGTLDRLLSAWGGREVVRVVPGPLGRPVAARYGLLRGGAAAVVELAAASGLAALEGAAPDPLQASTRGTGELVLDAVSRGAREVVVCVGGSASTDGGSGLLAALGFRVLDDHGRVLPDGGAALRHAASVDADEVPETVRAARFRVACDVTNPLLGPRGAAAVFAPQKGAGPEDVALLEAGLSRWAEVLGRTAEAAGGPGPQEIAGAPGSGAAGGTAAGLVALLDAAAVPGAELVADAVGLAGALAGADLVLTGEGRLDEQTADGKVVSVVCRLARAAGVPAVAVAGGVGGSLAGLHAAGLTAAFSLADGPRSLDDLLAAARDLLAAAAEQVVRLHGWRAAA